MAAIPTLVELCQKTIIKMLEDISVAVTNSGGNAMSSTSVSIAAKSSSVRNRLINDLCKCLPEHLLG